MASAGEKAGSWSCRLLPEKFSPRRRGAMASAREDKAGPGEYGIRVCTLKESAGAGEAPASRRGAGAAAAAASGGVGGRAGLVHGGA